MAQLQTELARLHLLNPESPSNEALTQTLVIHFLRAADWPQVSQLRQLLQTEFDFPDLAIAVSGQSGFLLWLPLSAPVTHEVTVDFLRLIRQNYLPDIPSDQIHLKPVDHTIEQVPCAHPQTGRHSAFIDPDMGAMFLEESGLDIAPNDERQAEMLGRIKLIPAPLFQQALNRLQTANDLAEPPEKLSDYTSAIGQENNVSPHAFLLRVMNDPTIDLNHRIEAAKALLPYFGKTQ